MSTPRRSLLRRKMGSLMRALRLECCYERFLLAREKGSLWLRMLPARLTLDREKASRELTAVIATVGESRLFESCLASVKAQSLPPSRIEVVRDVTPFSKACQERLDRVKTPFYVSVDDDMVLHPDCFETLYCLARSHPKSGEVACALRDPIMGPLYGVTLYRTEAVRSIGFHPLAGEKGCERKMTQELAARGCERILYGGVRGEHHPVYQPHEAFWRFRYAAERSRFYPEERSVFASAFDRILRYWSRTRDDAALYALAGLFEGSGPYEADGQLSYEGRLEDPAYLRVREQLSKRAAGEP